MAFGRWRLPVAKMCRAFSQSAEGTAGKAIVDHYKTLGVRRDAKMAEIKAKYKDLVKKYHPDVYKGPDSNFYKRVQDAYKVLASPKKRIEYDETLRPGKAESEKSEEQGEEGKAGWEDLGEEYKSKASAKDFYKDINSVNPKQMDVEKEHAEFFSKPITTDFGGKAVLEDEAIANFTEADRARATFVKAKNEETIMTKLFHHEKAGFDNTLKETIEVLNEDTTPKRKARLLAFAKSKGIRIGIITIFFGSLGFALVTFVFLGWGVRSERDRVLGMEEKRLDKVEIEQKSRKLKGQMVFD